MKTIRTVSLRALVSILLLLLTGLLYAATDPVDIPLTSNPRCIAINPFTEQVFVVGEKPDALSIVDLQNLQVLSMIPIGKKPAGVAIDPDLHIVVVSAGKDNAVFIIDLDTARVIATIPVGKSPERIAVDGTSHVALVANYKSNTVTVIDLITLNVIDTIQVGKNPSDIAIDPLLHVALVINEKSNDVSVIDLTTFEVTGSIRVGKKPRAISINPEDHLAVVANEKDSSLTLIRLRDWQTTQIPLDKQPIDVTVNSLTNYALVASGKGKIISVVDLGTGVIVGSYSLDRPSKGLAVNPFTNVAAVALDGKTNSLILIPLPNPVPEITSLAPDTLLRGNKATKLVVEGSGFTKASIPYFLQPAPYALPFDFVDNHHLEVEIPEELLKTAGIFQIVVTNPDPGGGSSVPVGIQINNPPPAISVLDPAEAIAGTQGLILTIHGAGFFNDTTVLINGQSRSFTLLGKTKLEVELSATDLESGAYLGVIVSNPLPGGGVSNLLNFTVFNPFPSLAAIFPPGAPSGIPEFTLTLLGDNFIKTSIVGCDDQQLPSTYVGPNEIHANIPLETLSGLGYHQVKVLNPAPGGGVSTYLLFAVRPAIGIAIISPSDGETINGSKATVRGTVASETNDIGVRVNGTFAEIAGNQWIATNVPLTAGANQIEAIATDLYGIMDMKTVIVQANVPSPTLEMVASPTIGIVPLQVRFSVATSGFVPVSYEMDFDGDGLTDYSGPTFNDISYTYLSEGIFYSKVTITDDYGTTYSDTVAINVLSMAGIDQLLRKKWGEMKESLLKGDIEGSIVHFDEVTKQDYRALFNVLLPILPTLVEEMSDIQLVEYGNRAAIYDLRTTRNGMEYSFQLLFTRDQYGVWRINFF